MTLHSLLFCLQPQKQQKNHLLHKQLPLLCCYCALVVKFFVLLLMSSVFVLCAEMFLADILLITASAVVVEAAGENLELMAIVLWPVEALLTETRFDDFTVKASIV